MFNLEHICYMIVSAIITVVGLVLAKKFAKTDKQKSSVLQLVGWLSVPVHFSSLYVEFFSTGSATADSSELLLMYPCNILMWLVVICGYLPKDKKFSKMIFEFVFFVGTFCGLVGIMFNFNYDANPTLANWFSLKGLLSHSFFLFGALWLLVGGFFKIRLKSCISVFAGLMFFVVIGFVNNGLYKIFNLGEPNCMYLQQPPFESVPWLNVWVMGALAMLLMFIITEVYELIALKKEDRTLYKLFKGGK
ncbi:MAG: YwaF family protein [Clostridia bacterium]|nr:YwaF family protein [Clostridia bacterium]